MSGGYDYSDQYGQHGYRYDSNSYSPPYHYSNANSPGSTSGYSDRMSGNGGPADAQYFCLVTGCNKSFTRHTDLQRHYDTVHRAGQPLIECPYKWCGRTGDRGFTRQDHYRDHLREVHQQDIPRSRKSPNFSKAARGS